MDGLDFARCFWLGWGEEGSGHVYGLCVQVLSAGQDVFRKAGSDHSGVLCSAMTKRSVLPVVSSLLPSFASGLLASGKAVYVRV